MRSKPTPNSPLPPKLLRPRPQGVLPRQRLFRLLAGTKRAPVTWVHAPAGSGKTMLLASGLARHRGASIWYEVDPSDRDVSSVFHHLGLASAQLLGRELNLPVLQPGAPGGLDAFARRFCAQLFAALPAGTCLAFDNYQAAASEPRWDLVFRELLAARPAHVRIWVASRRAPPPLLARFRVSGELAVIGFDALRFSSAEIQALARQRGLKSKAEAALIADSSQGWAVAASLFAGALRTPKSPTPKPATTALRTERAAASVFDFLGAEILAQLDDATRNFLLEVALLPHFSVAMAQALCPQAQVAHQLERLEREHLLLDRHEDGLYRLHDLFRAFLLDHARRTLSAEAWRALCLRAALVLSEGDAFDVAAELLAEAHAWSELIACIERCAPALAAQGRVATLQQAIERVPASEATDRPWLQLWSAVARLGRFPDARDLAERAFFSLRQQGDVAGQFFAWSLVVQSIAFEEGEISAIDPWMKLRAELPEEAPTQLTVRVALAELIAWPLLSERPSAASVERSLQRVLRWGTSSDKLLAIASVGWIWMYLGQRRSIESLSTTGRELMEGPTIEPFARLAFCHCEAYRLWLGGELDQADRMAQRVLEFGKSEGIHVLSSTMLGVRAAVALARGEVSDTRKLLDTMHACMYASRDRVGHAFVRLTLALELRDFPGVEQGLEQFARETTHTSFHSTALARGIVRLTRAMEGADMDEVRQAYDALAQAVPSVFPPLLQAQALLLLADCKLRLGEPSAAALSRAFRRADETGFFSYGGLGRQTVSRLCHAALTQGIEVEHARHLQRVYDVAPTPDALLAPHWPWPIRIRVLGTLQIEVSGVPVKFGRKLPTVLLAVLRLLALAGKPVPIPKVIECLWPGYGSRSARGTLDTALYRLRKLLGHDAAVQHEAGNLSLNPTLCWSDVRALDHVCERVLAADSAGLSDEAKQTLARVLAELDPGGVVQEDDRGLLQRSATRLEQRLAKARAVLATSS